MCGSLLQKIGIKQKYNIVYAIYYILYSALSICLYGSLAPDEIMTWGQIVSPWWTPNSVISTHMSLPEKHFSEKYSAMKYFDKQYFARKYMIKIGLYYFHTHAIPHPPHLVATCIILSIGMKIPGFSYLIILSSGIYFPWKR